MGCFNVLVLKNHFQYLKTRNYKDNYVNKQLPISEKSKWRPSTTNFKEGSRDFPPANQIALPCMYRLFCTYTETMFDIQCIYMNFYQKILKFQSSLFCQFRCDIPCTCMNFQEKILKINVHFFPSSDVRFNALSWKN